MDKRLLTICDNSIYADELIAIMKENGIECFKHDATQTEIAGTMGGNTAGIDLYVENEDYDDANRIIEEIKQKRDSQMPWCPECGGENITKTVIPHKHGPTWMLVLCVLVFLFCIVLSFVTPEMVFIPGALWIIGLIIWFKSYKEEIYRCENCGKEFKRIKY